MISVRRAEQKDLDWLVSELQKFATFFDSVHSMFDETHWRQGLSGMIESHLVLVAEKEGVGLIGLIAGFVCPHPFNPKIRVLSESFWWVTESHRQSRAGAMLLAEYMKWGEANCQWILMALEANSPVNEETLLKRGFRLKERAYLKEVV